MSIRMITVSVLAAAALAASGSAALASAAGGGGGGGGYPTPTPTATTPTPTPPPVITRHHHHPRCFFSVLSEFDSLHGQQLPGMAGKWQHPQRGEIVVVQLAKVCVAGHKVTATDIGQPFAWESGGQLPVGLPLAAKNLVK
jgi:hypothetical protein